MRGRSGWNWHIVSQSDLLGLYGRICILVAVGWELGSGEKVDGLVPGDGEWRARLVALILIRSGWCGKLSFVLR